MTTNEDEKKLHFLENEDETETGDSSTGTESGTGSSTGGSSGEVLFHFDTFVERRDDLLSPGEIKRLLLVEKDLHKAITNKQKQLIKERNAAKEGLKNNQSNQYANQLGDHFGNYETSIYKTHPISNTAQFSGATDRKVVGVPNLNEIKTNAENQNKLMNELKYQNDKKLRMRHNNEPDYEPDYRPRPKPTPFG